MKISDLESITKEFKEKGYLIGRKLYYHETLDSTMSAAKQLARAHCEEGSLIIAGTQTGGRGRLGRSFISPSGGLWVTAVLYPSLPPNEIPLITLASGIAVCNVIKRLYGIKSGLKWPNDVVIGKKKVCGILTEGSFNSSNLDYAILGIGINLNFDIQNIPIELRKRTSTLLSETGILLEPSAVLKELLEDLNKIYTLLITDSEKIIKLWIDNSITIGREVTAVFGDRTIIGIAKGITKTGSLVILDSESGTEIEVNSGEVSLTNTYDNLN